MKIEIDIAQDSENKRLVYIIADPSKPPVKCVDRGELKRTLKGICNEQIDAVANELFPPKGKTETPAE